jgi:uncharacterized delta-60 repeat protein
MKYLLARRLLNSVKGGAGHARHAMAPSRATTSWDGAFGHGPFVALLGLCLFLMGGMAHLQAQSDFSIQFVSNVISGSITDPSICATIYRIDTDAETTVEYQIIDNIDGLLDANSIVMTGSTYDICFSPQAGASGAHVVTITLISATGSYSIGDLSVATVTLAGSPNDGPCGLDSTFSPGTGANGYVRAMALQPDGKILLGGTFTVFRNYSQYYFTRLNASGTVDTSFNYGGGANAMVNSISLETNGNVVLAGNFTMINSSNRSRVARLDKYGLVNASLAAAGLNSAAYTAIGMPGGKLLAGGSFWTPPKSGVVRLLVNGNPDISFDPGFGVTNGSVYSMVLDGSQVIIGGSFNYVDVLPRSRVARINSDGQVDVNFVPPTIDGTVYAMALQPDRKLVIAGDFNYVNGWARSRIARLNADGSLDTSFNISYISVGVIFAVAFQQDGKILAGGSFTNVNGIARSRLARFDQNGALDMNFDPGVGANHAIYALAVEPNGKILMAGAFTTVNGVSSSGVARINGSPFTYLTASYNVGDDELSLTWPIVAGQKYNLYYSEDLQNWTLLGDYPGSYIEGNITGKTQRFYRIRSE